MKNFEIPTQKNTNAEKKDSTADTRKYLRKLFLVGGTALSSIIPMKNASAQVENQLDTFKIKSLTQELFSPRKVIDEAQKKYSASYTEYEKEKKWLISNMESEEYKRRFTEHEQGTQNNIKNRISRVSKREYIVEEDPAATYPSLKQQDNKSLEGYYNPATDRVHLSSKDTSSATGVHEFTHQANQAGFAISGYARKLYKDSYDSLGNTERDKYLSQATERDARKKELEYEMERLGIKKYEEQFTKEHYNEILKRYRELSSGSREFIDTTKEEYFLEIMNTIAQDNNNKLESI